MIFPTIKLAFMVRAYEENRIMWSMKKAIRSKWHTRKSYYTLTHYSLTSYFFWIMPHHSVVAAAAAATHFVMQQNIMISLSLFLHSFPFFTISFTRSVVMSMIQFSVPFYFVFLFSAFSLSLSHSLSIF
jgi:hypothetical protein